MRTTIEQISKRLPKQRLTEQDWDFMKLLDNHFDLLCDAPNEVSIAKQRRLAKQNREDKSYVCIHLDTEVFMEIMCAVIALFNRRKFRKNPPKFLDVGCGIGHKVLLADALGFDAYGLEFRAESVKVARNICNEHDVGVLESGIALAQRGNARWESIIQANALTFKEYHMFDVLYYYVPIHDIELQKALEHQVFTNMKPGAMVIAVGGNFGYAREEVLQELCTRHSLKVIDCKLSRGRIAIKLPQHQQTNKTC